MHLPVRVAYGTWQPYSQPWQTSRALRLGNRMMQPTRDFGLPLQGLIVNPKVAQRDKPAVQEPQHQDDTTGVIDRFFVCANTVTGIDTIGPYADEPSGPLYSSH